MLSLNWIILALFIITNDKTLAASVQSSPTENSDESGSTSDCICVLNYLCEEGEIITDGSFLLDPRNKNQTQELPLASKYEPPFCGPGHTCCRKQKSGDDDIDYKHRCGQRNPNGVDSRSQKIYQSDGETESGEWPHQALILKKQGSDVIHLCGATLIDENHVLTAAHCVDKYENDATSLLVRLGEWDLMTEEEELYPHEDFAVEYIVLHPNYRKKSLFNDIAVLELAQTVEFQPQIDTICLPKIDDDFTGQSCIVTGWGKDAIPNGNYAKIMKEIAVPMLSRDDCQKRFRKTRLGRRFNLHSGFTCAGGRQDEDACKGDGGGPLICYDKSTKSYSLAGIVSWGIGCGRSEVPGAYVDVKKYLDFIVLVTGKPIETYRNNNSD